MKVRTGIWDYAGRPIPTGILDDLKPFVVAAVAGLIGIPSRMLRIFLLGQGFSD